MIRLVLIITLLVLVSCQQGSGPDRNGGITVSHIPVTATQGDSLFFEEVMRKVLGDLAPAAEINQRITDAGLAFLGTPYVASTLEVEGDEHLVMNLLGVDCTTFVEYVTAMALCSARERTGFDDFVLQLAELRYRGGIIDGYPSRLHYFTEWLKDNEKQGYIEIISNEIGNRIMDTGVGFMTANPHLYRQLEEEPAYVEAMAEIEKEISAFGMSYISKDMIDEMATLIKDGDIIAFVSSIGGLDVSHTGLAVFSGERLHLLHASSRSQEVEITSAPLSEYLADSRTIPGIIVARVMP